MKRLHSFMPLVMKLVLFTAFLSFIVAAGARAETTFGDAGDYLRHGAGARSLGMAGAFTAVSDDATAEYWNPAALAFLDEYQLVTMYAPYRLDTNLYYAAFGLPLGPVGTVAISDFMLRSDGFQGRNDLNFVSGDNESVVHNAISLSYARAFRDLWSLGARLRFLQQQVLSDSGSTAAIDLSAYSRPWRGISAGLSLSNLNSPKITLVSDPDDFRRTARFGLAYRTERDRLIIALDANKTQLQDAYYTAGLEYNPMPLLSLRAGWDQNSSIAAGVGLNFRYVKVDYAFSNDDDLGDFNKISLTWRWGNVYQSRIDPEGIVKETDAIYIEGLRNEVKFKTVVPRFRIHRWTLAVMDASGKIVRQISEQSPPPAVILWDMTDQSGKPVKRGRYKYLFRVEYKNGKVWDERGKFRLDYKTNAVPEIDLRMRGEETEGLEGTSPLVPPAPSAVPEGSQAPDTTAPPTQAPADAPRSLEVPPEPESRRDVGAEEAMTGQPPAQNSAQP